MVVISLRLEELREAPWNPNQMDEAMLSRLRRSITRYGVVENLVVRPLDEKRYEVLSGNQRLRVLRELGYTSTPCFVVNLDDPHARMLAQALNRIEGEDDLGMKADLVRRVLEEIPSEEVVAILPETVESLKALSSLGQQTIADYLKNWEQAQAARLKHLQFQLTVAQLEIVEQALAKLLPQAGRGLQDNPNTRGKALYLLCQNYLDKEDKV